MRILLDENFPKSAAEVIVAAGHEVISFADVCEFGADDEEVFGRAGGGPRVRHRHLAAGV